MGEKSFNELLSEELDRFSRFVVRTNSGNQVEIPRAVARSAILYNEELAHCCTVEIESSDTEITLTLHIN